MKNEEMKYGLQSISFVVVLTVSIVLSALPVWARAPEPPPASDPFEEAAEAGPKYIDPFSGREIDVEPVEEEQLGLEDRDIKVPLLEVERVEAAADQTPQKADRRILDALYKPVRIDSVDQPLTDVVELLSRNSGVAIELDCDALSDVGIDPKTPVTIRYDGIMLRSVLRLMLRPLELTYRVENHRIVITTPDYSDYYLDLQNNLTTRIYPITDLATSITDEGQTYVDSVPLVDLITTTVQPETWDSVGGPGSISYLPTRTGFLLIVVQTPDTHQAIGLLLKTLRKIVQADTPKDATTEENSRAKMSYEVSSVHPKIEAAERRIENALKAPIRIKVIDQTLAEVVAQLSKTTGIPVVIDDLAMEDVGIDPKIPVNFEANGLSIHTTLRNMLRVFSLTYVIQDEIVLITTHEEAERALSTRIYPITDLTRFETEDGRSFVDSDSLIDTITMTVDPSTWDCVGGPGSLAPIRIGDLVLLVLSQTEDVQDQIVTILRKIRRQSENSKGDRPFYHTKPEPLPGMSSPPMGDGNLNGNM